MFAISDNQSSDFFSTVAEVLEHELYHNYDVGSGIVNVLEKSLLLGTDSCFRRRTYLATSNKSVTIIRPSCIVGLYYVDEKPVSVMVIYGNEVSFFTKLDFRQLGYAKELFKEASKKYNLTKFLIGYPSEITPIDFFKKLGIKEIKA